MRKFHQKQLLELVYTLGEANLEIQRLLANESIESVGQLVSDCQWCAGEIADFIQRHEGDGTKTSDLLEEYRGRLSRMSKEMCGANDQTEAVRWLQRKLVEIERSVKTELKPNKLEIAFLSYKASMFDALESVWLAANADPQCDAYVVAIPYFDRLPGGALGQMHCEGESYPDYIPVTDWRTYDIAQRRPDVIVVHNPYDAGNFVTSVHPDFYCERLKKLTDLLVYIPYFVSGADIHEALCVSAGTLYAGSVIVQSERIRDTYIRAFQSFEKTNKCTGKFGGAKAKFIALGSPKFDKVINTKREDYQIPEEWRKLLSWPDGTRKKVILFSATIGTLLNGNDKLLHKLRDVFGLFQKRDDVLLWWRPHPLGVTTYETMRPALLKEFLDTVGEYRRQGWGIYDDTADMNRSIAVSDAYYGTGGSVMTLYQCTGKPLMLLDMDILDSGIARGVFYKDPSDCALPNDCSFTESAETTLSGFLEYVLDGSEEAKALSARQRELQRGMIENGDGNAGPKIYDYIKSQI